MIGSDGDQLGIVPLQSALIKADDIGLDLVEISPNTNPPVCKILDYGKYIYEKQKLEKKNKKKQTKNVGFPCSPVRWSWPGLQ